MKEIWKDVPDYEGMYKVSNIGNVKSLERTANHIGGFRKVPAKPLTKTLLKDGYYYVMLSNPIMQVGVNQLIAMAFLNHKRCKFEVVIDHKDNNKTNNVLSNLQLTTNRHNSTKDVINKTGFVGVTKQKRKFKATIRHNGKSVYLGMFKTAELAHEGYLQARKQIESNNLPK